MKIGILFYLLFIIRSMYDLKPECVDKNLNLSIEFTRQSKNLIPTLNIKAPENKFVSILIYEQATLLVNWFIINIPSNKLNELEHMCHNGHKEFSDLDSDIIQVLNSFGVKGYTGPDTFNKLDSIYIIKTYQSDRMISMAQLANCNLEKDFERISCIIGEGKLQEIGSSYFLYKYPYIIL